MYKEDTKIKGRREFLILSTSMPLLILPTPSEAIIPALILRFFARRLISNFIKRGTKRVIRNVVIRNTKKKGRARVVVTKAIQIHSRVNHIIDAHKYLSNQVWNKNKDNHSTLVIHNPSNKSVKTEKIALKMKNTDRRGTEFKAKIKPIRIAPKSTVVVDLKVKKIRRTGIKRLHVSHKRDGSSSGNILVANNTRGLTIEQLYRRYYKQQKRGGIKHGSNGLMSGMIL